jgi:hypothetical protein
MIGKNMLRDLCLLAFLLAFGAGCAEGCSNEILKSLVVEDTQFRFVKERDRNYVKIIGALRNTGKDKIECIHLVTRYLDAEQRLIDVQGNYDSFDLTFVPGKELPFRFREETSQPESAYVSHQTHVAGADCEGQRRTCVRL